MNHKRSLISVAMATIVLVSLCAVCATTSVSAAPSSSANAKASDPTRTSVSAAPSSSVRAAPSGSAPDGVSRSASANAITSNPASTSVNTAVSSSVLASAPAGVVGSPALCAQHANSLDLFVRGADNACWWRHEAGGGWSAWKSLGGQLTSSPAAANYTTSGLYVGVRGTNGQYYYKYSSDGGATWWGWNNLGGQILAGTGPAVWSPAPGIIRVAVTGTNNALYWWNGGWINLGGQLTSSPGATTYWGYAVHIGVRGTNGAIYRTYSTDGGATWGSWYSFGGQLLAGTSPAVIYDGYNIRYAVTGTNSALYYMQYPGGFVNLGGGLTSSPAAASNTNGTVDLVVRGTNGPLYWKETTDWGNSWTPWYQWVSLNYRVPSR